MIQLALIYAKLEDFLRGSDIQWEVYYQLENPFLSHRQPSKEYLIWVKLPLLDAHPEPSKHWRVPAVIAGRELDTLLLFFEKIFTNYSPASYWRNLRPLPPEEIGIWEGWSAFSVDLYIDFNHLCEV